jgi:hypothetical protein
MLEPTHLTLPRMSALLNGSIALQQREGRVAAIELQRVN